jgi:hypothetical protein
LLLAELRTKFAIETPLVELRTKFAVETNPPGLDKLDQRTPVG